MSSSFTPHAPLSHKRPLPLSVFYYGAPYYPEHWNEADRQDDAARMAAAGFNMVRMAEFAWDLMEPTPGTYNFDLFDAVIDHLASSGIKTMMCTPTAAPPRWLTAEHPEVLRVDADGRSMQHGSRQHCCYAGETFRQFSRTITRAMAEHYAGNPNVVGWQTDNEFNCVFTECHCDSCQVAFREFLQDRYGSIDKLNDAWGVAFWAQTYTSFDQVTTPKERKPSPHNPSARLDYYRHLSWIVTRFQHEQVEILRGADSSWWITHNGIFGHIDYAGQFSEELDFLSFDSYPFFLEPDYRRFGQAYTLDRARAYSGNFLIPEQQSGPGGNHGYIHETPEPGELRRMVYTSVARGADSVLHFRWRTARFGAEEYWCGILDHDNVPRRRYEEVVQTGSELKRVGPAVLGTHVRVDVAVAGGVQEADDTFETYPMALPAPATVARDIHRWLEARGYAVGVVRPDDDLSDVKVYVLPHWEYIEPDWVPGLMDWVASGGTLVVGARSGSRTTDNHITSKSFPGELAPLCGVTVEEYGNIRHPDQRTYHMDVDGYGELEAQTWYEVVKPRDDAVQVLARWTDRHLEGKPAITCRTHGKGRVLYVGTLMQGDVIPALWQFIEDGTDIDTLWPDAPRDVQVVCRQSDSRRLWFLINHAGREVTIGSTPKGTDLVTEDTLDGGEVNLSAHDVLVIDEVLNP